jgi:hypothetical protein
MSGQIWIKTDLEDSRKSIMKDLVYMPIVVQILVIDGQVLKIKTYIWLEINKIIKHA